MQPIEFIAYYYYSTAYYIFLLVLSWVTSFYYIGSNTQRVLQKEEDDPSQIAAFIVTLVIAVFIGLRPIASDFGDMGGYADGYKYLSANFSTPNFTTEWFWGNFQRICKYGLRLNVYEFFLAVSLVYYGGMLICSFILLRKNLWVAILFFLTSFQTYTFATNGIRNGMACSMVLIAIGLVCDKRKLTFLPLILMYLALGIHRSTMLPSLAAIISLFVIKDTKLALRFWVASIAISLVAGNAVENFFGSLGFDDRMSAYSTEKHNETVQASFSHTGFRWDFLLYSVFGVIMIWYITQRRRFNDISFNIIANTFLLCNAFWIMVIRASFSNRFAFLSWFLYPLVMAYPLLRMNIWKDQDRKTALIFFAYSGFTFFMFFVYYFGTTGFKGFDQFWWRK